MPYPRQTDEQRRKMLAQELSHRGSGYVPNQNEINTAIDVGMGRKPADIAYGEEGLRGGMEIARIGDMPVSLTDLIPADMGANALAKIAGLGAAKIGALPVLAGMMAGSKSGIQKMLAKELKPAKTEFELAHEVAQRNAALPVEQGGLGLHPDNTAMDRAKALGYPMDMYGKPHKNIGFTNAKTNAPMKKAEIIKAELEQLGIPVRGEQAVSGSTYLDIPGNPYQVLPEYGGGQAVPMEHLRFSTHSKRADGIPINEPSDVFIADVFPKYGNTTDEARQAIKSMIAKGGIRSRFAAFDPMQRNSANILAGGAAGGVGLNALYDLMKQKDDYQ